MGARKRIVGVCTGLALACIFAGTVAASLQQKAVSPRPNGPKEGNTLAHQPVRLIPGAANSLRNSLPAPRLPNVVLYDQTDNPSTNAFNSQNFEAAYDEYDDQAADDFVVTGAGWSVTTVTTPGVYFNGTGPAPSLNITFYENAGTLPGAIVTGCNYANVTTFTGGGTGTFVTTLPTPCLLTPGPKWVSVQVNMAFTVGGQWGWTMRTVQSNSAAAWRNPGGAFPGGCLNYTTRTLCDATTASTPDHTFRLDGTLASCSQNSDCQDGDACNGAEVCNNNVCGPGTPVNCDDGLFCTNDSCTPATGACNHAVNPCGDGDSCTLDFCNEDTNTCNHVAPPPLRLCNSGSISIPDSGPATPFPSTINVSGQGSTANLCSVELLGISHTYPNDIDILVTGPGTSQNAIVMSDVGGTSPASNVNLTLKDGAAASIPTPLVSGTFRPTNSGSGDGWPGGPPASGGSSLGVFDGTNPNGAWGVYVLDDVGGDQGSIANGWCINIVVAGCENDAACNDGNACNGVETCSNGTCAPGTPVNCDDGLFCTIDGCTPATGACTHVANPCSDGNPCTSDSCNEGADACVNQLASVRFCNSGAVSIPSSGAGSPYPTAINISGQPTEGSICSVELLGLTHTFPDDIDILLARTAGANALIMSDVGGGSAVNNVSLVLSDAAATALPDGAPLVSGTFRPANYNAFGPDGPFPAPAPAISGPSVLSTFDGQNPNGVWNLWVRDEFTPDAGTLGGGWCLNIVFNSCTSNDECGDGNACNGAETCDNGSCRPGNPIDCSDGQFCTTDLCDPATGSCSYEANPCSDGDGCTADSCDESSDTCGHQSVCVEVCNPGPISILDSTVPPTPAVPYPSSITVAAPHGSFSLAKVRLLGISHTFPDDIDILLTGPNSPLNAILMSDVGGSTAVTGVDVTLTDGAPPIPDTGPLVTGTFAPSNVNPGTGTEAWPAPAPLPTGASALAQFNGTDPNGNWNLYVVDDQGLDSGSIAGGWCLSYRISCSTPSDCDDSNPCTTDTCNPDGTCSSTAANCDDGNPCTDDTCTPASGCVSTPNDDPCDDGNACTTGDYCAAGYCYGGYPPNCGDNNPCTDDACDPQVGCTHTNNTGPCDDGNACTLGDACGGGTCNPGTPLNCDDNSQCTDDSCNPTQGCVNAPRVGGCDDGNSCTANDICVSGGCQPGTPVVCNDGNGCTDDSCNPSSGCVYTNNTAPCSDGNACTVGDTCGGGTCHGGATASCDDGNACTDDSCNPTSGCVHTNNTAPCSDGNGCTVGDTCGGGSCQGGAPVTCTASDQCHSAGTCDPGSGACSNPALPDGTVCDDGNAGTSGDACQAGVCTGGTACNPTNDPKTWGWYHSLCTSGGHSGDSITNADAACVAATTAAFAGISTAAQVCEILSPSHGNNGPADKAEKQLMTLALNICKQRICPAQGLDATCTTAETVSQAHHAADVVQVNPGHTNQQLATAECQSTEINNGRALELNTLRLMREGSAIRVNWEAPLLDDGTGSPSKYKVWRRPAGTVLPFVQIGITTSTTYLDTNTGSNAWQYNVTSVF
jgi:subtilisin-like proprotein convertase family protein